MIRLTLPLLALLSAACYERTLIVAGPEAEEVPDGAMGVDMDDDAMSEERPPAVVDGDPPLYDAGNVGSEDEDAAVPVVDAGGRPVRPYTACRRCNIDWNSECLPPWEHPDNFDCIECGCCTSDAMCAELVPRANLACFGRRGDGVGVCRFPINGGGPIPFP